jgi:hypothetical protein
MNEETNPPPSPDEARATLAAIDATRAETRRNIGGSEFGPNLIWCGLLWIVIFGYIQFLPGPADPSARTWPYLYLLWIFMAVFFVAFVVMKKLRPSPVKPAPDLRIAALLLVILVYAGIFWVLLQQPSLPKNLPSADVVMGARKSAAYVVIVSLFFNVIMGLTVRRSRFFVGLGLLLTAVVLVGYYFFSSWFMLWMGVVGGGTFILSGIFIRKFWK